MTNGNASDGIRRHRIVFFLNAVRSMLTIILFAANRRPFPILQESRLITEIGVSNGLCKHFRTCEHCVYFASMSSDQFSHASSEHFVNFPPAGISLY